MTYIHRVVKRSGINYIDQMENKRLIERITKNPDVCHGKPTIRGLRYPVEMILSLLASGMSYEEILSDYTDLELDDLLACIDYAAKITSTKTSIKVHL